MRGHMMQIVKNEHFRIFMKTVNINPSPERYYLIYQHAYRKIK